MRDCTELVLKKKTVIGYKVFANEDTAKAAGAKRCGGVIRATGKWNYNDFDGIDLECQKCGTVYQHYSVDDLETLVDAEHS